MTCTFPSLKTEYVLLVKSAKFVQNERLYEEKLYEERRRGSMENMKYAYFWLRSTL